MPSVAIIDACGTANPGAFEFVREFNSHGVNAVVASSVDINGRMGGVFLGMLADALDRNKSDLSYTLDRAVFDAATKLRIEPDIAGGNPPKKYGPRALLFDLVGNGNLRVCTPPEPEETVPVVRRKVQAKLNMNLPTDEQREALVLFAINLPETIRNELEELLEIGIWMEGIRDGDRTQSMRQKFFGVMVIATREYYATELAEATQYKKTRGA